MSRRASDLFRWRKGPEPVQSYPPWHSSFARFSGLCNLHGQKFRCSCWRAASTRSVGQRSVNRVGTLPIVTSGVNTALQASTTHRESQLGQTKLACMPFPLLSRLAARARFSLGIEEWTRRLDAIEAVLPAAPHFQGSTYRGDYIAVVATRWSGMMLVDTRDYLISPALVLDGLWEPDVTDWLRRTLKPGQVFVDIGANIGYFTLMGSRLVGERGRVFAVEPHPRLAELLTRNVHLNNLQHVTT